MFLGIDSSTYIEEKKLGAKFFDAENEVDPLDLFRINGTECVRIRLWVDPKSPEGEPYEGGNCDLAHFLELAALAQKKSYSVMLDFHYSDFWTDPNKQTIPKAWPHELAELSEKVYSYTCETLRAIKERGVSISFIQVGNEITQGMLWPVGLLRPKTGTEIWSRPRENYESLVKLINSGVKACREICPKAALVLHLERSFDKEIYDEFFSEMQKANVDFDIIGYSYYPQWHGPMQGFFENVEMCKKFKKRQMVVEVAHAFTLKDYAERDAEKNIMAYSEKNAKEQPFCLEYEPTPEGQAAFVREFLARCKQSGIEAVFWWEPAWIPVNGCGWASVAAQKYIGIQPKYTRNEWANHCLFDYEGKKLPAFDEYKI